MLELIIAASGGSLATTVIFYSYLRIKKFNFNDGKKNKKMVSSKADKKSIDKNLGKIFPMSHMAEKIGKLSCNNGSNFSQMRDNVFNNDFKKLVYNMKKYRNHIDFQMTYLESTINYINTNIEKTSYSENIYSVKFGKYKYLIYNTVNSDKFVDLYNLKDKISELKDIHDKIEEVKKLKDDYTNMNNKDAEIIETFQSKIENGKRQADSIESFIDKMAKDSMESQEIEKSCEIYNKALCIDL